MSDDHQPWSQWLIAYHDGELSSHQRERFLAHLSACPYCQHMLSSLERLSIVLQVAPVPWAAIRSAEEAWHQVKEQLGHKAPVPQPALDWLRWLPSTSFLFFNVMVQGAGLVVLLVTGLSVLGLIDVQTLFGWTGQTRLLGAHQVLSWITLRSLAEPLGWGASLIALPSEWSMVAESLLSMVIFGLLALILGLGYILSLWLLWHSNERWT